MESSSSDKNNGVRQKFESMYREISGKMKELAGKDETAADILLQLHQAKEFLSKHLDGGDTENKIDQQNDDEPGYDEESEEEELCEDSGEEDEDEDDQGEGSSSVEWVQYIDEATGVPYYSHLATGEVQWERPFQFFIDQSVLDYQDKC
eukprot:CAMPEP_0185278254 /NCGR_PEP_ID=MMETSP1359-20130426/60560_1 /TAXON_ID=552665 /ORGANISM="Bigelowiella longifila, Strain CCMP242" /LENGTH=148 /DNA_ID=CAMNT_0027872681 /DNA_START=47 /DNA_END=490 /DNA_ORIENTATION=-